MSDRPMTPARLRRRAARDRPARPRRLDRLADGRSRASGPDIALRVRVRLGLADRPANGRGFGWPARPWRRALLLALTALLALAAIAGAVGLGLPGLRLIIGRTHGSARRRRSSASAHRPPPGRPPAPPGAPEPRRPVALDEVEALTGVPPRLPTDPSGQPDAVYVDPLKATRSPSSGPPSDSLPPTRDPGIGLILMQFDGRTNSGYHEKLIGEGVTAEPVTVAGQPGFWISGTAHFFYYSDEDGVVIDDGRRWVDDALVWSEDGTTYRLETSLGRDGRSSWPRALQSP